MPLPDAHRFLELIGSGDVRTLRFYYYFGRYAETPASRIPLILRLKHADPAEVIATAAEMGLDFTEAELDQAFDAVQAEGNVAGTVACIGCVASGGQGTCMFKDRPKGTGSRGIPLCVFPSTPTGCCSDQEGERAPRPERAAGAAPVRSPPDR